MQPCTDLTCSDSFWFPPFQLFLGMARSKYPTSGTLPAPVPSQLSAASGPRPCPRPRPCPCGGDAGAAGGAQVPQLFRWGFPVEDPDQKVGHQVEDLVEPRMAVEVLEVLEVLGSQRVAGWAANRREVGPDPVDGTQDLGGSVWWPNDVDSPPSPRCNPRATPQWVNLHQATARTWVDWISLLPLVPLEVAIGHPVWRASTPSGSGDKVFASFRWGYQPSAKVQVFLGHRCSWAGYHRQKAPLKSKSKAVPDLKELERPWVPLKDQWRRDKLQKLWV